MAAVDEPFRISGKQLIEQKREVVNCTLSLDIALGGGIPRGCTVLVGGRPKLGKTTLSLQFAANAQKKYGSKVLFYPIEGRLTQLVLGQIQELDLSEDMFEIVLPPAIKDKEGNVLGHKKWHAEKWWDAIGEGIINNPGAVIIVDAIANMTSEKEQSEGMGYQDRGGKNKLESQFCRKYGDLVIPQKVTLFLLTHIMANTSGYGSPYQAKVGNDIKHQADVILFGKRINKWQESNGRILGHDMIYEIECSALGPPFVTVEVPLRYGSGIDKIKDTITQAITWDIIQKSGSWFTLPFTEEGDWLDLNNLEKDDKPVKVQGENSIRNWFLIRKEQLKQIEDKIRKQIFGEQVQ